MAFPTASERTRGTVRLGGLPSNKLIGNARRSGGLAVREEEVVCHFKQDVPWYKSAIIYHAHVRTFYNSDGDGIGDFHGPRKSGHTSLTALCSSYYRRRLRNALPSQYETSNQKLSPCTLGLYSLVARLTRWNPHSPLLDLPSDVLIQQLARGRERPLECTS